MINAKVVGMLVAAFVAGSFVASPELRAYAANTVGSADIINNSILSADIKDGEVKTADLGGNAVTSAKIAAGGVTNSDITGNAVTGNKIADGTIAYGDVSRNLIAVEHRDDCNCGGTGWDPNGTSKFETIVDDRITFNSVVVVTGQNGLGRLCWVAQTGVDAAIVACDEIIGEGLDINYAIFSNPAYGS
jgi:hypothetical protein